MCLAKQTLDLSFCVMTCHNDRQVLNNYFEPCIAAKTIFELRPPLPSTTFELPFVKILSL